MTTSEQITTVLTYVFVAYAAGFAFLAMLPALIG